MSNSESSGSGRVADSVQLTSFSGAVGYEGSSVAKRKAHSERKRISLSQLIKKLLGIKKWPKTLEGDQDYFGF